MDCFCICLALLLYNIRSRYQQQTHHAHLGIVALVSAMEQQGHHDLLMSVLAHGLLLFLVAPLMSTKVILVLLLLVLLLSLYYVINYE
jgi:uncharacterized membrane protein YecN with MAPEG domain